MARFDKVQREQEATSAPSVPVPTTNGAVKHNHNDTSSPTSPTKRKASHTPSDRDEDLSDVADSTPPPKKKVKKSTTSTVETDEQIAKRMQAELNAQSARSTRGAGSGRKRAPVKKKDTKSTPKKKSKAKISSKDDSDLESGSDEDGEKPVKERKGGFHKPYNLSHPLSDLVSSLEDNTVTQLSRPQTVKKIWEYVRLHELQDPNDKRQIRCDDRMRAVFKQERVHMFTMNKLLAGHLYPVDE